MLVSFTVSAPSLFFEISSFSNVFITCLPLLLQVFSHLLPAPLPRDEDAKERTHLHRPPLGPGLGFLWTVSQLLLTDGPGWHCCVHSYMGVQTSHHNGYVHVCLRLPRSRAGARPHLRPHHPIPVDQRGPLEGHVRVEAGQVESLQDDHHSRCSLLPLLASPSPGNPLHVGGPIPAQLHHLCPPHPLTLCGLRQLLSQPHRLRPRVKAFPQRLQEGVQLLAEEEGGE